MFGGMDTRTGGEVHAEGAEGGRQDAVPVPTRQRQHQDNYGEDQRSHRQTFLVGLPSK